MMNITKTLVLSLCWFGLGFAMTACKGGDGASSAAKPADDPGAAPAKLVFKPLGSLGIEAEVPDDAKIDDKSQTAGFPSVTIWSHPTNFVSGAGEDAPLAAQSFDRAEKEIKDDPNPFQKFTKEEKTADGWKLEYELQSMMDKTPVYGYTVRLKVGGKPFDCGSNSDTPAQRDTIIKMCASLRKAS